MNMETVFIRFVGGSKHNVHIGVRNWPHYFKVPISKPIPVSTITNWDAAPSEFGSFQIEEYQLCPMKTEFGTLFYEYHVTS